MMSSPVVRRMQALLAPGAPIMSDDFQRADGALGTTPTGQPWIVSGTGAAAAGIVDGRYTDGPPTDHSTSYAATLLSRQPLQIGGSFSLVSGPGGGVNGVLAMILSGDASITLQHMLHLVIDPTYCALSWWLGAQTNQSLAVGNPGQVFMRPALKTDGTVYNVRMTVDGNNVYVVYPDGSLGIFSDPHVSQVVGSLPIYELVYRDTSLCLPRWESVYAS